MTHLYRTKRIIDQTAKENEVKTCPYHIKEKIRELQTKKK